MIKLKDLIKNLLCERMSFDDLMRVSDPKRKERSTGISTKSLLVNSINDREAWKFSYKTNKNENTTGLRHQGYIYFYKDDIKPGDNALKLDCSVDCSCPDYKFRFAYNNAKNDAGELGVNSLNKNNGAPPMINIGPGLCKHLIALRDYLLTEAEPTSDVKPEPTVNPSPSKKERPEEPEEKTEEPTEEPAETDSTQSPDDIKDKKEEKPENITNTDTTQTPKEPDKEEPNEEDKEKIKENSGLPNKNNIINHLNKICECNKQFVVLY